MKAYAKAPLPMVITKDKSKERDDLMRLRSKHSSGITASTSRLVGYGVSAAAEETEA